MTRHYANTLYFLMSIGVAALFTFVGGLLERNNRFASLGLIVLVLCGLFALIVRIAQPKE